jgi:hypothetical protein
MTLYIQFGVRITAWLWGTKSISVLDCVHGMNLLMESADPGIGRFVVPDPSPSVLPVLELK